MAKNSLTEWDIVAANNTDVGGIAILGSSPVSNFDNAIRTMMSQLKAGAAAKADPPVDVASAATTDIGAAASWNVRITGTTTITSFGTAAAGTIRFLRFAASLTLTYNAVSMLLPGAANIVTQAGDTAIFYSEGSGSWRCMTFTAATPAPYAPETGTFTPTLFFGVASTGITYGGQVGRYTKVGRIVHIEGSITLTSKGSATGSAAISGLPFTIGINGAASVVALSNFSSLIAGMQGIFIGSSTSIGLRVTNSAGTTGATEANFTNTSVLYFSGSYSI